MRGSLPFLLALMTMLAWPAAGADPAFLGRWQVIEYDPYFADNPLFGQYKYELRLSDGGDAVSLQAPKSGMRLRAPWPEGPELEASGEDPSRGAVRLRLRFDGPRFEGTIHVGGRDKRITGLLTADQRLQLIEAGSAAATQRLKEIETELQAAQQSRNELEARNLALEDALAASRAAQRVAENDAALARQRVKELEAERATGPVPVAVPVPAPATKPPAPQAGAPSIELIEPPLSGAGAQTATGRQPVTELIGRVSGGDRLFAVRVNGRPARLEGRGLFSARVAVAGPSTPVSVVAIDVDGRRSERAFTLVPEAGSGQDPGEVAGGPEARCYRLGVAGPAPDEAALEACRAAVRMDPDRALNHYNLGVVLARLGRHEQALNAYREAAARWTR